MDDTQLWLPDDNRRPFIARHVREGDVETLCAFLKGRGWVSARDIEDAIDPWFERKIRAVASMSEGRILSGQDGYKLTIECTPEEALRASQWLRSQGKIMITRSIAIARGFHNAAAGRVNPTS